MKRANAARIKMTLKVLHLSSERSWRGGEQQIAYLLHESEKLGVDVYVAVKTGSEFEKYCISKKLTYYSLPFSNSMDFKTAWAINKLCKSIRPDIIHMHSSKSHGIGILSAIFGNKIPLVLSRRVDFVPKESWFTKFKYNHNSIRKIICVSDKINEIIRGYIKHPERSITVHSGVDLEKFQPLKENILRKEFKLSDSTFIIGNTSALEGHKDYFTFLNAIAVLRDQKTNIKAFIVGAGSLEEKLKKYSAELNLDNVVVFTGFRKDILQVVPSFDLFLMTSNEEGLGTSVLDAFAAGVPVVATKAGGIPEMVEHNVTGMLAPIADHKLLAENVHKIMEDKSLRDRLVANAKKKLHEFSKEKTAQKTIEVYEQIKRGQ